MELEQRVYTLSEVAKESPDHAVKTVIYDTDCTSAAVWVVHPGQTMSMHRHDTSDDVWICLQGEGLFHPAPGEDVPVAAGQLIMSPKGVAHGFTNTGDVDFLYVSVVAPVPADYHAL